MGSVYIYNLGVPGKNSVVVGLEDLCCFFSKFQGVITVRILEDKSGTSTGVGHVRFDTMERAKRALVHTGTVVAGRKIKLILG